MSALVGGVIGGVLVLALVVVAAWFSRTRTLHRRVGSFTCAWGSSAEGPWAAGVAHYGADRLYWWRRWSLAPRPGARLPRAGLTVVERRWRDPQEQGQVAVTCLCSADGRRVHLLMSPEAYAGLTSWIEATPSHVGLVI